ncbi:MAG: FAD-binding oxidoreductase [Bacteroidetes bacterium]|nr:MAG: FAD-binding oxidoreductase [Bacteroidota bacterium]
MDEFAKIVGESGLISDREALVDYSHDETEDLEFYPEIVLKPTDEKQISAILKICNKENIPITPRGAGTGLSGGALPIYGGVVLSTEKLNKILEIDERNLQIKLEPGVITQVLQEAVIEKGLFYPPDPSSRGSCFIGGNVLENAGGPKAVKYGVTSDYVLNLEVVLPTGEIIWTGANVLKNSTGYNLTQLIVGSEGTLGIVTKIVLRLIPYPDKKLLMLAPFFSAEKACEAVSAIFQAGITPSGLEFMERDAIDWTLKFVEDLNLDIKEGIEAHLLIEVDGNDQDVLFKECEKITAVLEKFDCDEILFAENSREQDELWRLRRLVAEAVKSNSVYKEEDTVVPRAELPALLKGVKAIGAKYGFKSVCYGHAGDGNLHVNIIKGDMDDNKWNTELPKGIREIFELCVKLGGTLSGEHGIGLVQKEYMDITFNATEMRIQREIKQLFDPKNILNPGKIFPSANKPS